MNVLFVCTGNTCRSPMAEHLLKKMAAAAELNHIHVESAGVAPALDLALPEEAVEVLKEEGVLGAKHRPKAVTEKSVEKADVILTMESHHREFVLKRFSNAAGKTHLVKTYAGLPGRDGIADPFGGTVDDYRAALADIKNALASMIRRWKT